MSERERKAVLTLDEMNLKTMVSYGADGDKIDGFVDCGQ